MSDKEQLKKILDFDVIKLNYNLRKICKCDDKKFTIDIANRLVYCSECEAIINPFDALVYLGKNPSKFREYTQRLYELINAADRTKLHMNVFKKHENNYRLKALPVSKEKYRMLPHCPKCGETFRYENIKHHTNELYVKEV